MEISTIGPQLHDRATRGGQLTSEEELQLEAWYTEQDNLEAEILGQIPADQEFAADTQETIQSLRTQINTILVELSEKTKQIQLLIEQNNTLRDENSTLRQQLVQQTVVNLT